MSFSKGFTLVEMLLGILIVGILSTFIYINFAQNSEYEAKITKSKAFATSVPLSLPTSFLANWKFDGNTSAGSQAVLSDLADSWSNNNAATTSGVTVLSGQDCMFGKCLSFDGTGGISTGSSSGLFNGRSNWTISAWVKPDSDGGKDCFYSEGNGVNNIFSACISESNDIVVTMYRGGRTDEVSTSFSSHKIQRGKWNYVVISLEKGDLPGYLKFWLGGDLIFTATGQAKTDTISATDINERIGVGFNNADRFKGVIDDIQVYSDYIPSAAVATVSNELASIAITTPATKTNYAINDTLDITGLVVTGTYSDSSTKVETVTASNVSGFDSANPAESQTLTINVGGKTTTYGINVVPTVPTGLACGGATSTSISCSWNFVIGTGITYKIRRNSNDSNIVSSATKPAYDTGLTCKTSYNYEISACVGVVCSAYSTSISASTLACPPATPTGFACDTPTTTSLSCHWNAVTGTGITYTLSRTSPTTNTYSSIATTSQSDSGLTCGTTYNYSLVACNEGVCSVTPATTSAATSSCAPDAPTGFACSVNSGTAITCSWTGSTGATTYELQRNATTIQDTSAVSRADSGLTCGTSYTYQVRAKNAGGNSAWVATSPATTTTIACPPAVPTISVVAASSTSNTVTYNLPSGAVRTVITRVSPAYTWTQTSGTTMTDTGLTAGTQYCYNAKSCSAASNASCSASSGNVCATPVLSTIFQDTFDSNNISNWTQSFINGGGNGDIVADSNRIRMRVYKCYSSIAYRNLGNITGDIYLSLDYINVVESTWGEGSYISVIVDGTEKYSSGWLHNSYNGTTSGSLSNVKVTVNGIAVLKLNVVQSGSCSGADHSNTYMYVDNVRVTH